MVLEGSLTLTNFQYLTLAIISQFRESQHESQVAFGSIMAELRTIRKQDPPMSNMTNGGYGRTVKSSLIRDGHYTVFGGDESGRSVLSPAQVIIAQESESEDKLVAFLTPFFQAVCDEVFPRVSVVNSETIAWLPTHSGKSSHNLKPDFTVMHPAMILLKAMKDGKYFGGSPVLEVIETLRVVGEVKLKLDDEGFGEICRYTEIISQQFASTFGNGSLTRGILFDSSKFILIESNRAAPVHATEGRLDAPGSFELIRDFFSRDDPLTRSFALLCEGLGVTERHIMPSGSGFRSFLGKGRTGKAFAVTEANCSDVYVLKVVFSADGDRSEKTLQEFRRLKTAYQSLPTHIVRVKIDSFIGGEFTIEPDKYSYCGYLMEEVGVTMRHEDLTPADRKHICCSLNALHLNGIYHGDARVPNVVNCNGHFKWIDLLHVVSFFKDAAAICDVKTLFESMFMPRRIEWGDVSQQLESYGEGLDINVLLEILQTISSR